MIMMMIIIVHLRDAGRAVEPWEPHPAARADTYIYIHQHDIHVYIYDIYIYIYIYMYTYIYIYTTSCRSRGPRASPGPPNKIAKRERDNGHKRSVDVRNSLETEKKCFI